MKTVSIFIVMIFISGILLLSTSCTIKGTIQSSSASSQEFVPYNFVMYGDTRQNDGDNSGHETVVRLINNTDAQLCLHSGDMVNQGGVQSEWDTYYHPTVSHINKTIYYAIGNHEYYTDDYDVYDDDLSVTKANIDIPNLTYYSFDSPQNDTHFIVLNSEYYFFAGQDEEEGIAQDNWLKEELQNNFQRRIVVMFHRPIWGVNPKRVEDNEVLRDKWHELFVSYGVAIVVNGHDHHFYSTIRDGVRYVVSGGGTTRQYPPDPSLETWQEGDFAFMGLHICVVKVEENKFKVDTVVANGSIVYQFEVTAPIFNPGKTVISTTSSTLDVRFSITLASIISLVILWKKKRKVLL